MMKRGALIVFEGCDRSGKTTQCKKMLAWLERNNRKAHFMRFPDRTSVIGGLIGKYLECSTELDDRAIHLLFSANRWEMLSTMMNALNEGKSVIIDRYAFSGTAFSAAKPGMDLKWCMQSDTGLPKPDLVIFLDLDPEDAKKRGDYGAERYENFSFQKRVRENYMQLKDDTWKVVNANRPSEEIHTDICSLIEEAIDGIKENSQLDKLWVTQA